MIDQAHAVYTQTNNVVGNLNVMYAIADIDRDIHLVKLGTMGEYGTPNIDIEEGWIEIEHKGRTDRMLYPKRPGSFYHLSKVHDSHNIEFGCRIWGLRATDLNQGVVYGADTEQTELDPRLATRFDYDGVFGTVLNRMVIQAVLGHPLTVYGNGGQTRGLINIVDTVECIRLGRREPRRPRRVPGLQPDDRVDVDQQIAETIANEYPGRGHDRARRQPARRARRPLLQRRAHRRSRASGLEPHLLVDTLIDHLFDVVERYKDRVDVAAIMPTVRWRETSSELPRPPARWPRREPACRRGGLAGAGCWSPAALASSVATWSPSCRRRRARCASSTSSRTPIRLSTSSRATSPTADGARRRVRGRR